MPRKAADRRRSWALTSACCPRSACRPTTAYVASLSPFHAPGARFDGRSGRLRGDRPRPCPAGQPERLILFGDAPARALLGEPLAGRAAAFIESRG
jgi:hypothetical protein